MRKMYNPFYDSMAVPKNTVVLWPGNSVHYLVGYRTASPGPERCQPADAPGAHAQISRRVPRPGSSDGRRDD